jgi:class 3 adenylate cyclase
VITDGELRELGLYHPDGPFAEQRLELLRYVIDLGATVEDLVAYREELPGLAMVVALRGGGALTFDQVVARSGVAARDVHQIVRAAGFPQPGPEDRVFAEGFVSLCRLVPVAKAIFGEEAVLQLVRVMGSAMARVADALVSSFLANVEPAARLEDPVGLAVARANTQAVALFPEVAPALDVLLRQHLVGVRRASTAESEAGFETRQLCVGFVDLVDSTSLAQRLSMAELGGVLTQFENITTDMVTAEGGRVVKLIGDEVLYTAADGATGCRIALDLAATFADHPSVPRVRAGVASGDVMLRDGDVFGPVVNLAARAAKVGGPGEVVAPTDVALSAGLPFDPLGPLLVRGFDPVEFCRLRPFDRSVSA